MILLRKIFSYYTNLILANRSWVYAIVVIFTVGFLSGIVVSESNPNITKIIISIYSQSIDKDLNYGFDQFLFIAKRNTSILLVSIASSVFLGITSSLVSFINGATLGLFVGFSEIYQKINPWQFFWLLFPHGIFEYSATFLGLGFGLKLGLNWALVKSKGRRRVVFFENLRETIKIAVLVVGLLIFAAIVEGYLTQIIACLVSGICRFR